jgi:hypothetical protein
VYVAESIEVFSVLLEKKIEDYLRNITRGKTNIDNIPKNMLSNAEIRTLPIELAGNTK